MKKRLFILFIIIPFWVSGQQNQQLYFMHYIPESNFLNPAVQSECKWFIGLPIISSVHINYANSALSYRTLFSKGNDGAYHPEIDRTVNQLGRRSFIGAEFHTTLLALGYRHGDKYFAFSVIEKINAPVTIPRQVFQLGWKGNSQFEGENAGIKGTAAYLMHYREYALGYSTVNSSGDFLGIKAKLLFGKLNAATPSTDLSLYTDKNTFDLTLHGDLKGNMSAPVIITQNGNELGDAQFDENTTVSNYLLNRKNWGFAVDLGIIHEYNENITLAASILDLGFIRWRSNLTNISTSGNFHYTGIPFDSVDAENYFDNLVSSYSDSVVFDVSHNPYFTLLPIKIYAGARYNISEKLVANALLSGTLYRSKLLTGLTLSLDYNPFRHFHVVGSYSLMYRSFKIIGLGLSMGRGPLQFYILSDNVCGFIWPLSARNINLRFGLNINLGCNIKSPRKSARDIPSLKDACKIFDEKDRMYKRKTGQHR
jgi:hypothetical protein